MNKFFYIMPYWRSGSLTLCGANFDCRFDPVAASRETNLLPRAANTLDRLRLLPVYLKGLAKLEVILMLVDATTLRADDQLGHCRQRLSNFSRRALLKT